MRSDQRRLYRPPTVSRDVAQQLLDERNALQREVERLRSRNAELLAEEPPPPPPVTDGTDTEALLRRVDELTRDLTRVQQRTVVEVEDARISERAKQLAGLGDVLDSVQRGLDMDFSGGPDAWQAGLSAIETQLLAFVRDQGATLTGEVGVPYDPTIHEAVSMVNDSGWPPGRVAKIVRRGIVLAGGHVVRSAQVCVQS